MTLKDFINWAIINIRCYEHKASQESIEMLETGGKMYWFQNTKRRNHN